MANMFQKKFTLDSKTGHSTTTIHTFSQDSAVSDLPTEVTASALTITGCDPDLFITGQTYLVTVEKFG